MRVHDKKPDVEDLTQPSKLKKPLLLKAKAAAAQVLGNHVDGNDTLKLTSDRLSYAMMTADVGQQGEKTQTIREDKPDKRLFYYPRLKDRNYAYVKIYDANVCWDMAGWTVFKHEGHRQFDAPAGGLVSGPYSNGYCKQFYGSGLWEVSLGRVVSKHQPVDPHANAQTASGPSVDKAVAAALAQERSKQAGAALAAEAKNKLLQIQLAAALAASKTQQLPLPSSQVTGDSVEALQQMLMAQHQSQRGHPPAFVMPQPSQPIASQIFASHPPPMSGAGGPQLPGASGVNAASHLAMQPPFQMPAAGYPSGSAAPYQAPPAAGVGGSYQGQNWQLQLAAQRAAHDRESQARVVNSLERQLDRRSADCILYQMQMNPNPQR